MISSHRLVAGVVRVPAAHRTISTSLSEDRSLDPDLLLDKFLHLVWSIFSSIDGFNDPVAQRHLPVWFDFVLWLDCKRSEVGLWWNSIVILDTAVDPPDVLML